MSRSLEEQQARGGQFITNFLEVLTAEVRDILDYNSSILILHRPAITSPSSQKLEL